MRELLRNIYAAVPLNLVAAVWSVLSLKSLFFLDFSRVLWENVVRRLASEQGSYWSVLEAFFKKLLELDASIWGFDIRFSLRTLRSVI